MEDVLLEKREFEPMNATRNYCEYSLHRYSVKNGYWYRIEKITPDFRFFRFKCYRSEAQAREKYDEAVKLEEWRSNKKD